MTENVTITTFRGREGLDSLRSTWEEMVAGMPERHFFQLWEWYHGYLECLATDPQDLMFFLFTKGGTPAAILPLQSTPIRLGGLKLKGLAFPSHNHLLLNDLVCHREATQLPLFQLLSQYLRDQRQSWDLIRLPHLLEDACTLRIINNQPPPRFLLQHEGRCDFMDTSGTYDLFLAGISRNFRRSLKRTRQYLDELPGVQFAFTQEGQDLEEKLEAFMDVEASGWKGAQGVGTAIKLHPSLRCFYQTLTRTLSASGKVSINTLTTDGKCIAAQFCLRLDDRVYILKIGYDEAYKRYAPGNLLVDLFIKRCMEDCLIKNVNLITDAEWHRDWKPQSYERSALYLFNASPGGLLGLVVMKGHRILKQKYAAHIQPRLPKRLQEYIGRLSHGIGVNPHN